MDVSSFLAGKFLTHLDLPQPFQVWTIGKVDRQMVGRGKDAEEMVCVVFAEFPAKPLATNKTNLKRLVKLYSIDAAQWTGKQVLVYRTTTSYGDETMLCVRLCGPQQAPPETPCDKQWQPVRFQPVPPTLPAAQDAPAPVAAPQADGPNPWEGQQNPPGL